MYKKLVSKKKSIIILILFLYIFTSIIAFVMLKSDDTNARYRDRFLKYDDDWTIITPTGEVHSPLPVSISTKHNEKVVFTKTLPDTIAVDTGLMTRNYHQILEVRVDGEVIAQYPNKDWNRLGNIISDEWILVDLLPEHAGKKIEISYMNSSAFIFSAHLGDFYYGEANSLVAHIKSITSLGFGMGVNMCVIGIVLLIISFIYRKHTAQAQNSAMGSALLFFGMWLTNRAKMPHLTTDTSVTYYISLMSLLLVAPCIFLYSHYRSDDYKRISLYGAFACAAADILVLISCIFIPYNVEILAMISYFMSCVALVWNGILLYSGSYGRISRKHNRKEILLDKTEFYSNMLFPVATILEVLLYHNMLWTDASTFFRAGTLLYTWIYMGFVLWRTFMVVQDRTLVTQRLQESQLELMMGQIQPHFVFNTLSSIRTLVMVDPTVAYDMLYDFSNYLRANIDNVTNLNGIPFSAEVSHIKSYVNIEKVRFGERLNMKFEVEKDDFKVPPLSIQPLVENAIKHGIFQRPEGGTVILRSYDNEKYNIIEVEDDGIGFDTDNANRIFAVYIKDEDNLGMASNKVVSSAMDQVLKNLTLLDKDGKPIVLSEPIKKIDRSGNGSEEHTSTGMINIFMRLKEMGRAHTEIYSKEGEGTRIKVFFPKEDL